MPVATRGTVAHRGQGRKPGHPSMGRSLGVVLDKWQDNFTEHESQIMKTELASSSASRRRWRWMAIRG